MNDPFLYRRCLSVAEKINNLPLKPLNQEFQTEVVSNKQLLTDSRSIFVALGFDVTIIEKAIRHATLLIQLGVANG